MNPLMLLTSMSVSPLPFQGSVLRSGTGCVSSKTDSPDLDPSRVGDHLVGFLDIIHVEVGQGSERVRRSVLPDPTHDWRYSATAPARDESTLESMCDNMPSAMRNLVRDGRRREGTTDPESRHALGDGRRHGYRQRRG